MEPLNFNQGKLPINQLLQSSCCGNPTHVELINNLLRAQRNKILLVNKHGLQNDIEKIIDEYLNPSLTNVYKQDSNQ